MARYMKIRAQNIEVLTECHEILRNVKLFVTRSAMTRTRSHCPCIPELPQIPIVLVTYLNTSTAINVSEHNATSIIIHGLCT
jgi:hypothetical protein